jgi:hypothetical protein
LSTDRSCTGPVRLIILVLSRGICIDPRSRQRQAQNEAGRIAQRPLCRRAAPPPSARLTLVRRRSCFPRWGLGHAPVGAGTAPRAPRGCTPRFCVSPSKGLGVWERGRGGRSGWGVGKRAARGADGPSPESLRPRAARAGSPRGGRPSPSPRTQVVPQGPCIGLAGGEMSPPAPGTRPDNKANEYIGIEDTNPIG